MIILLNQAPTRERKMKPLYKLLVLGFILTITSVFAIAAATGPDTITIDLLQKKKPAVVFEHKAHFEKSKIKCATCHHKAKEGETPAPCRKCHLVKKDPSTPEKLDFKSTMHKKCKGCHKQKVREGNKKMIPKCIQCHVKKK